ncbi:hypothetical protein CRV02_14020 [Arcobacter sp. CECT 8989]|uniref:hypothetical protein n=1 Tax=Arcobacter sp. CECT 8989 TaxID=2044509 RepID=UPI00100BA6FD|nr:hypothetical protein [Arcobacter sp. CECT 8989]RXJ98139.1 hypothetical protein CRV02_14020 [Arcobacter sp. CECT 8989]
MAIQEEKIFFETLEKADIIDFNKEKIKSLHYGFDKESRNKVHLETNNLLEDSLNKNSLGECIHITGEMRALTDPFHRYLCEKINNTNEDVFKVVYNLPQNLMNDTTKIIEWNLDNWSLNKGFNWIEELRTIYSIANRSVNLYSLDTTNKIQYSVFGNKYILFQGAHEDKSNEKHTWLLESESLNIALTQNAEKLINISTDINEGHYRKFTQELNSFASKRVLSILGTKDIIQDSQIFSDTVLQDLTDSIEETLNVLKAIKFINYEQNQLKLTLKGRSFFDKI